MAKLVSVSSHEVLTQLADPSSYATAAINLVWGGGMPNLPIHPPGMSWVAGLVARLGVPWRIVMELFYLGSCSLLAWVSAAVLGSRLTGLVLFALMAWHPWTFAAFDEFMSDPFVLVVQVALLASLMKILERPTARWRWKDFVLTGMFLFLWEWSRHEDPLVYACYLWFLFLVIVRVRWTESLNRQTVARFAMMLVLPLLMVFCLSTAVKAANQARFGIYAKAAIGAPGLMSLMRALYKIKPEQDIRYAPVTRQSLEAACRASPTLQRFEGLLLDPKAPSTMVGEQFTRVPGEFGPWLNWLLFGSMGYDFRRADALMLEAAAEINQALRDGRLPSRTAFFPLDPNYRLWLPDLLPCIGERFGQAFSFTLADPPWGITDSPHLAHLFDQAANRRRANMVSSQLMVEGSLQGRSDAVDNVAVMDENGTILGASRLVREDDGSRRFGLAVSAKKRPTGLEIQFNGGNRLIHATSLNASGEPDKGVTASEWKGGTAMPDHVGLDGGAFTPETNAPWRYHVDARWVESKQKLESERFEKWLARVYPYLLIIGLVIAGTLQMKGDGRDPGRLVTAGVCCLFLAGWMAARAILYGLVDANMAWKVSRYVRCISPLSAALLVNFAGLGGAVLGRIGRFGASNEQGSGG